jgi:hypothetical protein
MEGPSVRRSTAVAVGPQAVWAVLADFDGIAGWAPVVDHSTSLTARTEGVGAARRVQVGRTVLVERVTEWEPATALAYDLEGLPRVVGGAQNRWELRPQGDGTAITLTSTVDPGPLPVGRLVAPLLARRLGKASDGLLAGLADHLRETRP